MSSGVGGSGRRRRRKEQERLRREEEEERVRLLDASLDAWIRAQELRAMIEDAKGRAARMGREIPKDSRLGRWLDLAERRAARLDPLPPLLSELEEGGETRPSGGSPAA
jgi:hypothetical protein